MGDTDLPHQGMDRYPLVRVGRPKKVQVIRVR